MGKQFTIFIQMVYATCSQNGELLLARKKRGKMNHEYHTTPTFDPEMLELSKGL